MAAIVNSGKKYITDNIVANVPSHITRFILANVEHSDPKKAVDLDEGMPSPDNIVYNEVITRKAQIDPDQVVFSQILASTAGDFDFNWIGLGTDDGTLIAVVYVPMQHKRKYEGEQTGNTITRNVVLKFANAAKALDVIISPETWQFDFTDFIRIEIKKIIAKYVDLVDSTVEIVNGAVNIITSAHNRALEVGMERDTFTIRVSSKVDLDKHNVTLFPPTGEKFNSCGELYDAIRFISTDTEFRLYREKGEWCV